MAGRVALVLTGTLVLIYGVLTLSQFGNELGLAIVAVGSVPVASGLLGADTPALRLLRVAAILVVVLIAAVLFALANADFENV